MRIGSRLTNAVAVLILAISFQASAATYTVKENFVGTWEAIWGLPISSFTHTSSSQSLISGETALFNGSSTQSTSVIENVVTCVLCAITETLNNGDKIFSTHGLLPGDGLIPSTINPGQIDNFYNGTVIITGGTGLFSGAYGSGTFTAIDFGVYNIDEKGNFVSFNPNGNWNIEITYNVSTPVPEPESYVLFILGFGLLGLQRKFYK